MVVSASYVVLCKNGPTRRFPFAFVHIRLLWLKLEFCFTAVTGPCKSGLQSSLPLLGRLGTAGSSVFIRLTRYVPTYSRSLHERLFICKLEVASDFLPMSPPPCLPLNSEITVTKKAER